MIPRIVLTGGPCGGKTTALQYLKQHLPAQGVTPVFVPELATAMFDAGVRWPDVAHHEPSAFRFQAQMIKSQITNEDMYYSFVSLLPGKNKVLVCDRGTVDNMVYARDEWHEDILSQVGSLGFLKRRYDQIIHLNTLAYGGEYHTDNVARYESAEDACRTDARTWEMWARGPHVPQTRIEHNTSLTDKMEMVLDTVRQIAIS